MMGTELKELDGKLYCMSCDNEVDEYGDTLSSARDCSYCPIDCEECGLGWCDNSC